MKATLVFLALVACSITQANAATTGSAASVVAVLSASSASAAKSKAMAAIPAKSDCGACHQEFFPFDNVNTSGIFSENCFEFTPYEVSHKHDKRVFIYTRQCGKLKRFYLLNSRYTAHRYFLPADKETFNPHYILREDAE